MQQKPRLGLGGSRRKTRRLPALGQMLGRAPPAPLPVLTRPASGRETRPPARSASLFPLPPPPAPVPPTLGVRMCSMAGPLLHGAGRTRPHAPARIHSAVGGARGGGFALGRRRQRGLAPPPGAAAPALGRHVGTRSPRGPRACVFALLPPALLGASLPRLWQRSSEPEPLAPFQEEQPV